ncbi:hypothetical protein SAMN05216326_1273 [Nitrosomonas marina]|uniref:Uncharacterized protein n=1 Tax=Nitrosomonas marina TaxID=917 RepID=A0A1I0EEV8_9PROT|nr:hypothetical protein [Nitrosomonas marina]SET43766.1 hypothetical protein SAMN05216326_1273 [Nitrosomonas marina]
MTTRKPKECSKCGGTEFYKCGGCKQCKKERNREWVAKNRDKYLDYMREANKKHAASKKRYHEANKADRLAKDRVRYAIKKHIYNGNKKNKIYDGKTYREHYNELMRKWKRRNKHKTCANEAYRRAMLIQATPPWANKILIEKVYSVSRARTEETGINHNVDHIVPLISDIVCGLHVHENLRVITAKQNINKGNKFNTTTVITTNQ